MTGFEPATTRPPDAYSTGLSYIPLILFLTKSATLSITSVLHTFARFFEGAKVMLFSHSAKYFLKKNKKLKDCFAVTKKCCTFAPANFKRHGEVAQMVRASDS